MLHRGWEWKLAAAIIVAAAILAVAGCGGDDSGSEGAAAGAETEVATSAETGAAAGAETGAAAEETTPQELTTVKVGVIPVANLAPFYLGIEKGFFEEQGLDLDVSSSLTGAPQNVPRLLQGDLQFVATAWLSTMLARAEGLPVVAIAPSDNAGTTAEEDYCHVMTAPDGPKKLSELEGATIAINTLKNVGEVSMDATLDKAGVDLSTIEYVQIPWPEMGAALRNDRVDAGWVCEPFLTQLKRDWPEANDLGPSQIEAAPNLPISVYVTSEQFLEENPDIVRRFQAAMAKSLAYVQEHPDEARAIIPTYTEIDPAIVEEMILPTWDTAYDETAIQALADQALKYGILEEPADVAALKAPFPLEGNE